MDDFLDAPFVLPPDIVMSDSSDSSFCDDPSVSSDALSDDSEDPPEERLWHEAAFPVQTVTAAVPERRPAKENEDDSDESDVEDHDYLRNMSKNFTDKIKEKNDAIKLYKKVLFNSQLQLVRREAAHQRRIRKLVLGDKIRKELEENKKAGVAGNAVFGGDVHNGRRDALLILPEEIWLMILEYVTDVKDLRACSKVCLLFERLLDETKSQWLYGKAFPLIFNYLRRKEILNCRGVCRRWRLGTDHFLENYYTLTRPEKENELPFLQENLDLPIVDLKTFHFEYNFSIPPPSADDLDSSSSDDGEDRSTTSSQQSINRNHDKVRGKMSLCEKNPFIGRSVTLEEDSADFDGVPGQADLRSFVTEAKIFFGDFGSHIWHLSICCNLSIQTPSQYYDVCLHALSQCPDLKSLCLGADLSWRVHRSGDIFKINQFPPPVDHSSLESLQVDVDTKKVFIIQNKLVRKYSNQLKRLEVQFWNSEVYFAHQWSVLRELQINKSETAEMLQSLKKMKAPNLRKLSLRLDGKGRYLLETLLELSNHFPKMDHLELKFESRFGLMTTQESMSLPPGLTSSASLTTLELSSSVTDVRSYNFLLYFPFLRKLLIRHGHWTRADFHTLHGASPYFQQTQESKRCMKNKEVVKIAKFVMQDGVGPNSKLMYKSNVWKMLPFLQVLELRNARHVPEKKTMYTREGYEYYLNTPKDEKP